MKHFRDSHNLILRLCACALIALHLATFGPIKDAFAFTAQSANFKLATGSQTQGGSTRQSAYNKISQDSLTEPTAGKSQSANFILNSGFIPTIQSNPPTQTKNIPNFSWKLNESKPSALDLDDYFISPDGSPLNYSATGNSKIIISIDSTNHKVSFSQASNWYGTEKIRFTARDDDHNSIQSNEITLQVENISSTNPPVLDFIPDLTINENQLAKITPHATDPDGGTITYTFTTPLNTFGEWQTNYNSYGTYTILVTAADSTGLIDTQEVKLTVINVNRPPVIDPISDITALEGALITINVVVVDPDANSVNLYYSSPLNSNGSWLTGYDDAGTYTAQVIASDGIDTTTSIFNIIVLNNNRTPQVILTLDKYTARPNETIAITVSATEPDSDPMTFSVTKNGSVIASGNILSIYATTTTFSSAGDQTISVTVTDSGGLTATDSKGVDVDYNADRNYINPVMGDFNGDAVTDLGIHNAQGGTWEICLSDKGTFRNATTWASSFGTSLDWWPVSGDFNADGKTDIGVYHYATGQLIVGLSSGSGFSSSDTWLNVSFASYSWQPFTGNFNGDKYTDFALYNKDTGEVKVALGTGSGFTEFTTWILAGSYTNCVAMSGDFNADSLADLCLFNKSNGNAYVAFSNSTGFVDGNNWMTGFGANFDLMVSDFNGDGLSDIGFWDKSSGWYYAISKGDSFINKGVWLSGFGTAQDESATTGDFNGDGVMDAAAFDKDKIGILRWTTRLSTDKPTDLLTAIDNGIGGKTQIIYTYAANSDNSLLPFPVYVASSISSINTFPADRAATYTQNFNFSGGYYDATEREFRGFAKVKITDPATNNYTETYFYQGRLDLNQDGALKGQIEKVLAYDGNNRQINQTMNTYEVRKAGPDTASLGFPALTEQTTTVWEENGTTLSTKNKLTYDSIGNVIEKIEEGNTAVTGDERSASTVYAQAYTVGFNRPQEITAKDQNGATISKKNFTYDTKGNLTREQVWLHDPLTQAESWIPATYSYDSFGNVTSSTNALGSTVSTDYETTYYTYPGKVTNSLGHAITYIYEPKFGAVKSVTDPNGNTSTTTFDSLGRVTQVKNALNQIPTTYSYPDFNTKVTTNALGLAKTEYIDGLGRKYKTVSSAEDGTNARNVSTETYYNNRGLTEKESLPHYVDESSNQISYVTYEYDIRGRVIKTTSDFPGTVKDAYSAVNYINPLYTETTDPLGHRKGTLKDIFGNIKEVTEFSLNGIYITKYEYDVQNNLAKTTDSQGNTTQIYYDSLGRKIKMDDPDMGIWTYEYDDIGNLIKQTDAKGQILQFAYDALNRLNMKQGNATVTYIYDDSSKENCIGRLSKITDSSGSTEFSYDKLGREIKSVKTVDSNQYVVVREYDILDRLTKLTYPDNSAVQYSYDVNSGLLEKVYSGATSYVNDISYNAKGQIKTIAYGNGTSTNYTYGQDLRLSRILTQGLSQAGTVSMSLQDLNYIFDKNGNITTLTDNLRSNIRTYTYDDLDRLNRAENVPAPAGGYTTFDYQYDSIGNMTYKSDVGVMVYGQNAGPHALTSAGGYTYQYDANGNMISGKNKTLRYDAENRLVEIIDSTNSNTKFAYDGDGGRVSKTYRNAPTCIYIGSLFEIDPSGTAIKHIFAGANRVCSVETGGSTYFYHSDHLGSSNIITDQTGQQVSHYEYTPYGSVATKEGTDLINHKFTDKELDSTTGLYFYGARYYDPEIGRFITVDPTIQHPFDPQDLNRYSYCRNNPLNLIDPTGLGWWKDFWKSIFKPLISAVAAVAAVFLVPSFAPLIAQYGFWTVAGTAAASAAAATATLDTGVGRQFIRGFARGFFDNVLGMSPGWANFFSSLVSHTLLASAYYMGLSSFTMPANYSGPDYTLTQNQNSSFSEYAKNTSGIINLSGENGGSSANYIIDTATSSTKLEYLQQGVITSDIAFKGTPGLEQVFNALNIRHTAALVNINGKLFDSAANISLFSLKTGTVYGMPWTATCHQSTFNTLMAGGMTAVAAFNKTLSQGSSSYVLSTSLYGINGGFGMSGISNAEIKKKQ